MDLTHFDNKGNAIMVDVTGKEVTERIAIAKGRINLHKKQVLRVEI